MSNDRIPAGAGATRPRSGALSRPDGIRPDAPVHVQFERVVDAPAERIWALLLDVQRWPLWHPGVDFAVLRDEPGPGVQLQWRADGMRIWSILHEVHPPERLSWTVRTLGARGYHRWTLTERPDGRTHVRTEESWWGLMPFLLRRTLRRTLEASRTAWLEGMDDGLERADG